VAVSPVTVNVAGVSGAGLKTTQSPADSSTIACADEPARAQGAPAKVVW
jgi:hypothetical protein